MKTTHFVRTTIFVGTLLLHLCAFCTHALGAAGDVDLSFNPGAGVPGQVGAAVLQPDGKVLVGGFAGVARLNADGGDDRSFQRGRGLYYATPLALQPDGKVLVGHAEGVVRLNSDGSTDTDFTVTMNPFSENNGVGAIAVQPDGKMLIGGSFGLVNGLFRPGIARLNGDGSIDSGFDAGAALSGRVFAIALQSDGKVLIGGRLATPTGYKSLLRLNADGTLDGTFPTPSNPSDADAVFSLALQDDGKIIAGGSLLIEGHNNVVRLNSNGGADPTFQADAGANNTIFSVRIQSDGKLLVAGGFTEVYGTPRLGFARLNMDGSLDDSFDPAIYYPDGITATSVVLQPDGKVLIGGYFTEVDGVIREGFARLEGDGTLDGTFNPGGGVNRAVDSLLVQPDGKVLISGDFTSVNGDSRNGIARLNHDGSLDPTVFDRGGAGSFGRVTAVALQADGKVLIGTEYGLARAHADGAVDSSFAASIETGDERSAVTSLAVQGDGRILVGGYSSSAVTDPFEGGITTWYRFHLTRLNPDGSYDTTFERTLGESLPNDRYYAQALAVQPDGKVLVAGYFFTFKGTDHFGIARVNSDGTLDTGFNVDANNSVSALALQPDGKLFIGGVFTFVDGASRRRVARLYADGSLDTSWNPGTGADSAISAIALQSDGKLLVAGFFNAFNGTSRQRIARLNADGSLDSEFIAFPEPDYVYALALQFDGKILMGGSFDLVNGVASWHVARLYADSIPSLRIARSGSQVILSWPMTARNVQLQETTDLSRPDSWSPVEQPAMTDSGRIAVTVPISTRSRFFRLKQ